MFNFLKSILMLGGSYESSGQNIWRADIRLRNLDSRLGPEVLMYLPPWKKEALTEDFVERAIIFIDFAVVPGLIYLFISWPPFILMKWALNLCCFRPWLISSLLNCSWCCLILKNSTINHHSDKCISSSSFQVL